MRLYTGNRRDANEHRAFFLSLSVRALFIFDAFDNAPKPNEWHHN